MSGATSGTLGRSIVRIGSKHHRLITHPASFTVVAVSSVASTKYPRQLRRPAGICRRRRQTILEHGRTSLIGSSGGGGLTRALKTGNQGTVQLLRGAFQIQSAVVKVY